MRRFSRVLSVTVVIAVLLLLAAKGLFGGGRRLEDRTAAPALPSSALQLVVNLDHPPGNIAVSEDGRVFFTMHPDGHPPMQVATLVDGKPVPYPDLEFQHAGPSAPAEHFQSVLSIRIDRQGRLWTLDYASYGMGQPRLLAFDLATNSLVHEYNFPSDVAGTFSMVNDFQVDPKGEKIYIADTSPLIQRPALIVYDTVRKKSRRVLQNDPSVQAGDYIIQAPGRDMIIYDIYRLRLGVDSIALDDAGEWLYYGPVTGDTLYRVRTADLDNETLTPGDLSARVEAFAPKTLSDGIAMDSAGNIYIGDMEHSAILSLGPDRRLTTLLKDSRLRWPDGFSFGPDGWLYLTCSSLQDVLFVGQDVMRAHAPYQIFRFRPGPGGIPGH